MSGEREFVAAWRHSLEDALQRLAEMGLGYPQGENCVHAPLAPDTRDQMLTQLAPPQINLLRELFSVCDGADLADIHNGIFLHGLEAVARREPRAILWRGAVEPLLILGSDGGGGRFALVGTDPGVYALRGGSVQEGVYDPARSIVLHAAGSLRELLSRVILDVEAFVALKPGHVYLT